MKKLLSLILLTILTSSCATQLDCEAKPDPNIQIEDNTATVDPGATVSCSF